MLVACQGNIGTSPPMIQPAPMQPPAVPQANGAYGVMPADHPSPASTKLVLTSDVATLTFPDAGGYEVAIVLSQPSAAPTPAPGVAPAASGAPVKASAHGARKKSGSGHKPAPATAAPSPSASATAAPAATTASRPGFLGSLFGGLAAAASTAQPSGSPGMTAASGSPLPSASASAPLPSSSAGAEATAPVSHKPSAAPVVELGTVPYPRNAPPAPTAAPSMSPLPSRHAVLRAEIQSQGPITIPSLDALLFTLPATELFTGRGFSVLVLEQGKHKHETVLFSDTNATLDSTSNMIHTTSGLGPILLQANRRYAAVLYADDPVVTPPPIPSGPPRPFGNGVPGNMPPGTVLTSPSPTVPLVPSQANPGD